MNTTKNYFFSLSIQGINILSPIITLPILVNALGSIELGKIAITGSIVAFFRTLGSSGLTSYGNKVIAKSLNDLDLVSAFRRIFSLQVLYTTLALIIYIAYLSFIGGNIKNYLWISIIQIVAGYIDFTWFFYGKSQIKIVAFRNAAVKILGVVLIFLFVKDSNDSVKYFLIIGLSSLFANLSVMGYVFRQIGRLNLEFKSSLYKRDLISSLYIILPVFIMSVYSNIDRIIIYKFTGDFSDTGIYDVGKKIIGLLSITIVSLRPIMITKVSENNQTKEKLSDVVNKSLSIMLYISILIISVLFFLVDDFVLIYLGKQFLESSSIIRILSFQLLLTGIGDIFVNQILVGLGKEKLSFRIILVLFLLLTGLYFLMVPIFGIIGAAVASVFAHFLILFLEYYYVRNCVIIKLNRTELLKNIGAAIATYFLISLVREFVTIDTFFHLSIFGLLCVTFYVCSCFAFGLKVQKDLWIRIRLIIVSYA